MALTKTPVCNFGEKAEDFRLKSIKGIKIRKAEIFNCDVKKFLFDQNNILLFLQLLLIQN